MWWGSGEWHLWGWGFACSDLLPQDRFFLPCFCGGDVWGLWGGWCYVFACPSRRETLDYFDKLSKLVCLKVR